MKKFLMTIIISIFPLLAFAQSVTWTNLTSTAELGRQQSFSLLDGANNIYVIGGGINDEIVSYNGSQYYVVSGTVSTSFPYFLSTKNQNGIYSKNLGEQYIYTEALNNTFNVFSCAGSSPFPGTVIWQSPDGASWTSTTTTADPLNGAVVEWDGYIYRLGGVCPCPTPVYSNKVARSTDGLNFTTLTNSGVFTARDQIIPIVSTDGATLYAVGGENNGTYYHSVFKTTDGQTWTSLTTSAAFGDISQGGAGWSYNNILYVYNNAAGFIYSSLDGITWSAVAVVGISGPSLQWASALYTGNNSLMVMGGYNGASYPNTAYYGSINTSDLTPTLTPVYSTSATITQTMTPTFTPTPICPQITGDWAENTKNAAWWGRFSNPAVFYNGKLYTGGGNADSGTTTFPPDWWSSADGVSWTATGGSFSIAAVQPVIYNGIVYFVGADNYALSPSQQVWSTTDFATFTNVTKNAEFGNDFADTSAVVFNNKIYAVGGCAAASGEIITGTYNMSVWYSSDGAYWQEATANGGWPQRGGGKACAFGGYLYFTGGSDFEPPTTTYYNDMWRSPDGITWTKISNNTGIPGSDNYTFVTDGNWMYIYEPYTATLYRSGDGINWAKYPTTIAPTHKRLPGTAFDGNNIWTMGGYRDIPPTPNPFNNDTNDVWSYNVGCVQPSYPTPTPTFTATPVTTPELDIVNSNTYKARVRWPNADTSCTYLLQYGLSLEESQSLTQYYNISPTNNYFEVEIPGLIQGATNEIRITQYNPNYNAVVSNIVYVTPTPIPAIQDVIMTPTP